jgi:hypothetical protein
MNWSYEKAEMRLRRAEDCAAGLSGANVYASWLWREKGAQRAFPAHPRRLSPLSSTAEKNDSNGYDHGVINVWRAHNGFAHCDEIHAQLASSQLHFSSPTASIHAGMLCCSCGEAVVRCDPTRGEEKVSLREVFTERQKTMEERTSDA